MCVCLILYRIMDEWQNHALKTNNEDGNVRHHMRLQRYMSQLEYDPVYRTVVLKNPYPSPSAFEVWSKRNMFTYSNNHVTSISINKVLPDTQPVVDNEWKWWPNDYKIWSNLNLALYK